MNDETLSPFKQMVASDVTGVFLNLAEWGEEHEIAGRKIVCIIDTDVSANSKLADILGVYDNSVLIYLKDGDIPRPKVGSRLSVDGSLHLVSRVSVETGMLVIVAEEARS